MNLLLEHDMSLLKHVLSDMLDECFHIAASGMLVGIDDEIGVTQRHFRPPDGVSLQAALIGSAVLHAGLRDS